MLAFSGASYGSTGNHGGAGGRWSLQGAALYSVVLAAFIAGRVVWPDAPGNEIPTGGGAARTALAVLAAVVLGGIPGAVAADWRTGRAAVATNQADVWE